MVGSQLLPAQDQSLSHHLRTRRSSREAGSCMLKGFGCRQAYESLSCRNPRAADDCLWGFVPRGVPAPVANFRIGCGGHVVEAASELGRRAWSIDSDGIGVGDDRRHGNVHITSR